MQICLVCLLMQMAAAERPASVSVSQLDPLTEQTPTENPAAANAESITFHLQVEYQCAEPSTAEGLFVSIADTYLSAGLPTDTATSDLMIRVPRAQLLSGSKPNCAAGYEMQRLTAQTTAFSTLICRNPDGQTTSQTIRTPLDVVVQCPAILAPNGDASAADTD